MLPCVWKCTLTCSSLFVETDSQIHPLRIRVVCVLITQQSVPARVDASPAALSAKAICTLIMDSTFVYFDG